MEPEGIHELTAAYALEALDDHQSEEFEEHLRHCPQCRDELVRLHEAAASMAYAAPPASPAEGLRDRLLEQARAERAKVLPFPQRFLPRPGVLAAATAVAATAAVALGIWALILHGDLNQERSARARDARALGVLAAPGAKLVALSGASGSLAVENSGKAVLVISHLRPAPSGRTYEAWVIRGSTASPAGLFHGGDRTVLPLSRSVSPGSTVGVTVERTGGVSKPTGTPILSAHLS
jgi:anti-sigma-K factor RskA